MVLVMSLQSFRSMPRGREPILPVEAEVTEDFQEAEAVQTLEPEEREAGKAAPVRLFRVRVVLAGSR